jgi:ABC-type uncharacterized transport system substrate-binding protein
MPSILAIAIGDPANSRTITNATQLTVGVRPYIIGLYNYLSQQTTLKLGTDYSIEYQECWEGDETFTGTPDIIFCMSTPVVRKAKAFTSSIPIVGIFSEHAAEQFDRTTNICGVNGKRIQNGRKYYDNFVQTISILAKVYILHRVGNTASKKCLDAIRAGTHSVPIVVLNVTTAPGHDIGALINTVPLGPQSGLLVLPVDLFFGASAFINGQANARSLSVFWPATDWTGPGVVAYGAAQEACGELMGKQVQYILGNPGHIPQGAARFVDVPDTDIKWVASKAAARALGIELKKNRDLQII